MAERGLVRASGRVSVTYCKAPTTERNNIGSAKVEEPDLDNLPEETIGVKTG